MRVKLRRTWFYPVEAKPVNDRREISGGRLRKGIHEIDNALRKYLPSDAKVLEERDSGSPVLVKEEDSLSAHDESRAEAVALDKLTDEYNAKVEAEEAERQERVEQRRLEGLKKAREKKAEKAKAKEKAE